MLIPLWHPRSETSALMYDNPCSSRSMDQRMLKAGHAQRHDVRLKMNLRLPATTMTGGWGSELCPQVRGFPQNEGNVLEVPTIRPIVYWGEYGLPQNIETTTSQDELISCSPEADSLRESGNRTKPARTLATVSTFTSSVWSLSTSSAKARGSFL